MSRSPLRDGLYGYSDDHDRLTLLHAPGGEIYAITDYNDELTGYDPRLGQIDPKIFRYGGNAYYITGHWVLKQGWSVEELEDRR